MKQEDEPKATGRQELSPKEQFLKDWTEAVDRWIKSLTAGNRRRHRRPGLRWLARNEAKRLREEEQTKEAASQ